MNLSRFFLFLILKFYNIAAENDTLNTGVQLWRAQGYFDNEVLENFYDRARFTEDIWKRNENTIDFLVYKDEIADITEYLNENNITFKLLLKDIKGRVDDEMVKNIATRRSAVADAFDWKSYPSLSEINRYLVRIASTNPAYCTLSVVGHTANKRAINMLKISNDGHSSILVVGGMHGRDWTAILSTLYFIESIVKNLTRYPEHIKKNDWYIIPVLNPDGFEYTKTTDRTWRKNRHRFSGDCDGVDINRNFDYNWCQKAEFQMFCNAGYCGPSAFSEEESQAIKRLVDGNRFHGFISIHSAGSRIIYPWSPPGQFHSHMHLTTTKAIALAMHSVDKFKYTIKNVRELNIKDAGMAIDWMFNKKQMLHTYIIETRGSLGLGTLEPKEILPVLKEVRAGLFKLAELIRKVLY